MRFPSGSPRWNHNWQATALAATQMRFPSGLSRWDRNWLATTLAAMQKRFPSGLSRWDRNCLADGHATANQSWLPPGRARRRAGSDERKILVACQFALHRGKPDGSDVVTTWSPSAANRNPCVAGEVQQKYTTKVPPTLIDIPFRKKFVCTRVLELPQFKRLRPERVVHGVWSGTLGWMAVNRLRSGGVCGNSARDPTTIQRCNPVDPESEHTPPE